MERYLYTASFLRPLLLVWCCRFSSITDALAGTSYPCIWGEDGGVTMLLSDVDAAADDDAAVVEADETERRCCCCCCLSNDCGKSFQFASVAIVSLLRPFELMLAMNMMG